jgi:hypothetical protein
MQIVTSSNVQGVLGAPAAPCTVYERPAREQIGLIHTYPPRTLCVLDVEMEGLVEKLKADPSPAAAAALDVAEKYLDLPNGKRSLQKGNAAIAKMFALIGGAAPTATTTATTTTAPRFTLPTLPTVPAAPARLVEPGEFATREELYGFLAKLPADSQQAFYKRRLQKTSTPSVIIR